MTNNNLFITAEELAKEISVSKPFAYKMIRKMNNDLSEKGFITIAGRVSRQYFAEKFYGVLPTNTQEVQSVSL